MKLLTLLLATLYCASAFGLHSTTSQVNKQLSGFGSRHGKAMVQPIDLQQRLSTVVSHFALLLNRRRQSIQLRGCMACWRKSNEILCIEEAIDVPMNLFPKDSVELWIPRVFLSEGC